MSEIRSVRPADLLLDLKNPRVPYKDAGQREALHRLAKHQGEQLLVLASHIIEHGALSPADLPIAMASEEEVGRYILLDGNRRLTAIRSLESPDSLGEALESPIMEKIRRLSLKYQQAPIEAVQCVIVADRDEAQPWIDLRHQGPLGGAGTVHWSPDGKARAIAQAGGRLELHTRLLNFLQDEGHLTIEKRETIPVTTLGRLLGTPAVRERIGIEVEKGGGRLRFHPDEQAVIKALLYIIDDITAGPRPKNVDDVRHVGDRINYAKHLPFDKIPQPTFQGGVAVGSATPVGATKPAKQASPLLRGRRERATVIPTDCRLRITERRIERIAVELRRLTLADYPNAIAVLFRVFIELSADYYLVTSLHRDKASLLGMKLSAKLTDIIAHLEQTNALSRQEAGPVKAYCQKSSFLAPSVLTMNEYVHNFHLNPTPTDLRAAWDGFETFLKTIWA